MSDEAWMERMEDRAMEELETLGPPRVSPQVSAQPSSSSVRVGGLDAQSLRDMREQASALAEQVLDDGYPFPREHRWWADQAEALARHVVALTDEVSRLVGCVVEAERRAECLESNIVGARAELAQFAKHPNEPLVVMAQHAAASVVEAELQHQAYYDENAWLVKRLAEAERRRDEALAQVAANHENLRRESERTEKAFRERDDARAALADARDALAFIAGEYVDCPEWRGVPSSQVAREALASLDSTLASRGARAGDA